MVRSLLGESLEVACPTIYMGELVNPCEVPFVLLTEPCRSLFENLGSVSERGLLLALFSTRYSGLIAGGCKWIFVSSLLTLQHAVVRKVSLLDSSSYYNIFSLIET